jgi:hypothetical protein
MSKSTYALGEEGARHAVKAIAATCELVLAASRSLDPGRSPELALIDLTRAREQANRVLAELGAAEDLARDAQALRDEEALLASTSPVAA